MSYVRFVKTAFLVASIALMLCGVCLLVWPHFSAYALCMALGVLSVVHGVIRLAGYFSNDLYRLAFQFDLAVGVLSILVGVLLILHPDNVLAFLPVVIGLFVLVDSVLRLQTAIDARHFGMGKWWVILLMAVAGAALGVLLLLRPVAGGEALTRLMGLSLLMHGGEDLLACVYTVRVPRRSSPDGIAARSAAPEEKEKK